VTGYWGERKKKVLIFKLLVPGAARKKYREIRDNIKLIYNVVAFLDDDYGKQRGRSTRKL
jgi:hypothetical protein